MSLRERLKERLIQPIYLCRNLEARPLPIGNFSAKTTDAEDMRKGKLVAAKINQKVVQMGVDVTKVKCLGGDATTLNTGVRNGIITQLERLWGHKVEWVTCLYHIGDCL